FFSHSCLPHPQVFPHHKGGLFFLYWTANDPPSCVSDMGPTALLRQGLGLSLTIGGYFACRYGLPPLLSFLFRALRVEAHYVSYSEFRPYVLAGLEKCKPSLPTSALQSEASKVEMGSGRDSKPKKANSDSDSNPQMRLAWVRVSTKFLQYVFLST